MLYQISIGSVFLRKCHQFSVSSSVIKSSVFSVLLSVTLIHVMCGRRCNRSSSSMSTTSRKERERLSLQQQTQFLSGKNNK